MHTRVNLPPLFPAQEEIARDPHRFKVVAAGRRFGKTKLASLMCVQVALTGGRAWWVAPSFPLADIGWREIKRLCKQIPGATARLATRTYYMPGGGFVQARSALTEAGLRGEGLDFVVVDECAFMAKARWVEELRPALSDREGGAMFISTPKGRNWFWNLWLMGANESHPEWKSWQLPSTARPTFSLKELEAARHELPDRVFQQEYMAQFMEDTGSVFRNIDELSTMAPLAGPLEGRTYIAGMDLGRFEDSTAICVMDVDGTQVFSDVITGTGWDLQTARVLALHERFKIRAWVVEKNFNEAHVDRLRNEGLPIEPFHSSNTTKSQIINSLALAMESGHVRLLDDERQKHELKAYTFTTTATGVTRYHAPEGEFDDMVIALALAWLGREGAALAPASTFGRHRTVDLAHNQRPGPAQVLTPRGVASSWNSARPLPGSRVLKRIRFAR